MTAAQAISTPRLILALLIRTVLMIAVFIAAAVVELMMTHDFPPDCGWLVLGPNGIETVYRTLTATHVILGTVPALAAAVATYGACRVQLMSWRSTQAVSVVWAIVVGLLILFLGFKFPQAVC